VASRPRRLTLVGTGITLPHVDESALRYNLANAHLHAAIRADPALDSVDVQRIDLPFSLDRPHFDQDAVDAVLATDPEWLGLSCYCWDIAPLLSLAQRVRSNRPATRVVAGGPSASFQASALIEQHACLDAVVRGEGELALRHLLAADGCEGIDGVTWRSEAGGVVQEKDRPMADLSDLASPLLDGVLVPPRQNLMFEFSRGCIYRCTYCAWKSQGPGMRFVPEARVRDEIAWAVERGYEHAFLIDSAINNDDARLDCIAGHVAAADPGRRLALSYFVNHAFLTDAQVRALGRIRAHEITVGLESVNPRASKAAGRKPVDRDAFVRAMDRLSEVAPATLSIMLGMPGDDLDGFRSTLDFIAEIAERPGKPRVRMARVHWMLIAPGSEMWARADRHGLVIAKTGIPYVLGSSTFPQHDLVAALHVLRDHPRSDLFVWEDAEPLGMLDPALPAMFASGGDHIGGRAPARIADDDVLQAIRPLVPGRALRGPWRVGPIERRHGWPVVVLQGPDSHRVLLQVRPREAEPRPFARTRRFDLVWLPSGHDEPEQHRLVTALVDLIRKND